MNAPKMLVLAKSSTLSTCENGLYQFVIVAREKNMDSQANVIIFIEIKDGLASLSNHRLATQDGAAGQLDSPAS